MRKWGTGPATVQYSTSDGTALAYDPDSDSGDYIPASGTLTFPAGETNKSFIVSIINDDVFKGDRTFWIALTNVTGGGQLAYPARAAITIIEDDPFGSVGSFTTNQLPASVANLGALQVYLEPTNAYGQWRLAGDFFWKSSGDVVSGLAQDNYLIEFKSVTNYYDLPDLIVRVAPGTTNAITNNYTAKSVLESGQLTVLIRPESVATNGVPSDYRGQWRLVWESTNNWHNSGETLSDVRAGGQTVVFKEISTYTKPLDREVTVFGGAENLIVGTYQEMPVSSGGGKLPTMLTFGEVNDTNWPYRYNGQLQTDGGFSSGVVVKERVVLTAAHALFNDAALSWVTEARWFFQKQVGEYEPAPQTPRGWYVLAGYAAQRSDDQAAGIDPGYSTSESQQLDAAALYFVETYYNANEPGHGGYGGYLSSDAGAYNEHFLSNSNKFLVGYPLVPDAETNWGKMYATPPTNLHFVSRNPMVFVTTDIRSFPGNSGGPLYVQWTNGVFYPAGIYLGGAEESRVRVIDGQVVDLINRAEASGNGGGNFTGGGVITISPNYTAGSLDTGFVQVVIGPLEVLAGTNGGAWRAPSKNFLDWTSDTNYLIPSASGFLLEFRPVSNWCLPVNQTVPVEANQVTILHANYTRRSLTYRLGDRHGRRLPD